MSRLLITTSVALNLFLLATIVVARVDVSRSRAANAGLDDASGGFVHDTLPRIESATSVDQVYEKLRSGETDLETAKTVMAAWLAGWHTELLRREVQPYWESSGAGLAESRMARFELESAARQSLVMIFGEAIMADPRFSVLFEPLGPAFTFLATAEQEALQSAILEHEVAVAASRSVQPALLCSSPDRAVRANLDSPYSVVDEVLTPAAAFEYALRSSPRAELLRDARLDLSEKEFRRTFALVRELDTEPDVATHVRIRRELREGLGEPRFDRLWARRDPVFALVRESLSGRGFAASAIESAYSVINRAQERLLELPDIAAGDERRLAGLAREIVQDETRQLDELLGDEAAGALLSRRTQQALAIDRQRHTAC